MSVAACRKFRSAGVASDEVRMTRRASWPVDLLRVTAWALRREDLRHQFLYATKAEELLHAPGVAKALETTVVTSIFEAAKAIRIGGVRDIVHECPYPGQHGKNPERADLALKESGPGKNWHYIEAKHYRTGADIKNDMDKLKGI